MNQQELHEEIMVECKAMINHIIREFNDRNIAKKENETLIIHLVDTCGMNRYEMLSCTDAISIGFTDYCICVSEGLKKAQHLSESTFIFSTLLFNISHRLCMERSEVRLALSKFNYAKQVRICLLYSLLLMINQSCKAKHHAKCLENESRKSHFGVQLIDFVKNHPYIIGE